MNPELCSREIPDVAIFEEGPGGLPVLDITSPVAEARIFLLGAQLSHWRPHGVQPVIFMSSKSAFEEGKAIRGGVPVCAPWFGPRAGLPAHGFLRNRSWNLAELRLEADETVRSVFLTASDAATRLLWPHDFAATLICTVGQTLTLELEIENTSAETFTFSEALHTYFVVGDVRQSVVTGLEGASYRDFPDRSQLKQQHGPIHFVEETDRIYVNTQAACMLEDPVMQRKILVEKSGSHTTTVWNPWVAKSAAMPDFGDNEWPGMVCIETANAAENSVRLDPGARHRMSTRIRVEPL